MKRKAQLWRFCDEHGNPLTYVIPRQGLHRFMSGIDPTVTDMTLRDARGFHMQLEAVPGNTSHFVMHRLRLHDLPSEYRRRRVVPLNPRVRGLAEGTNIQLISRNLAIFIMSGSSPRPARLGEYMRARLGWQVWLRPVPRADIGQVLASLRKVSSIELAIAADEARRLDLADFFEGDGDPLAVFKAASRARQGGIIRVRWSVGHGSDADQGFFRGVVDRLRRADLRGFSAAKAAVYVEGSDDQIPVDFLDDKIVTQVDVGDPTSRNRALDAKTALEALETARNHFLNVEKIHDIVNSVDGGQLRVPDALLPVPDYDENN